MNDAAVLIGKDDNPLRLSDHKPRYQIAQLSKFDAPRCLFSPHEADLPRNRPLIKMPDRQRRIGRYARLDRHAGQQSDAHVIGYHLDNRRQTGCLVGNRDLGVPQLARLQRSPE